MSNATKTRISELTALTSASLDTTIVGVDNGVTYKIELDTLADAVTTRVNILDRDRLAALEFATSSFETKGRNVVSGSSQLTSSYDARYVISGSIGAVPVGTVSGSSQVLGGSGVWSGSAQLPSGIISGSSQLNNQTITNLTITNLTTVNQTASVLYTSGSNQLGDELGDIQTLSGSVRVQGSLTINGTSVSTQSFVDVSALNSATSSYETNGRSIISSSAQISDLGFVSGSYLTSLNGAISSSTQISDLGFVTGSYTTINSFNSLTQSFNSISQSFNVISGSVGTIDFSTLATTGSNIFSGSQTISGGLSINNDGYSWSFESNGRTKIPNITFNSDRGTGMVGIKPAPGREFQIETSTAESSVGPWSFGLDGTLSAPVGANIIRVGNLVTTSSFNSYTASQSTSSLVDRLNTIESVSGSWITESETGSFLTSLSGAISSSSQLTSSYDTRYVISGSVGATPSGTISGSAQITAFGFISSSQTINTASLATTGSNSFNGNQTITGSLVVGSVAVVNGGITIPTGSVISLTSGSSLFVDSSGAITGSLTGSVFGIGDVVAFSSSVNSRIGNIVSTPIGTISGSSQLTSSFDTRYAISASFVSSSNLSSIQTITSASYAALTPVSGTLYIIIG